MWVLLGVLAGLAALLAIPVDLRGRLAIGEERGSWVQVSWLFGLVHGRLKAPSAATAPARKVEGGSAAARRRAFAMLRAKGFARHLLRTAGRFLATFQIRWVELHLRVGLDDPYDTGLLLGAAQSLRPGLEPWLGRLLGDPARADIDVQVDFLEAVLSGYGAAQARVIPLRVTGELLRFSLAAPTGRALLAAVRAS